MTRSRGFSLIETSVALALLGVIVVSILSAFSAATLAGNRHQQLTTLDILTRSDAEYIKSQTYIAKPATYTNLAAAGYSFSYVVNYYLPSNGTFTTGNSENGLQELVLTVTGPGATTEVLYFLKVRS
jgi:prepilin-type N-terminal cleavage/methylation domain-containing protein